mmetsp:Transcript_26442/g.62050  ORF Transcript_26442/g.62050 Transcript_26442/m.62050 type:complete len:132 (+) Transcript_26442:188-583(+)|eukprot:CAMPEP_0119519100 /NCGR_PEP_ID=MMETSP1344-20130328/35510_1 /TAXON_ID=236787 /ORGANISM="Florenciella parvula, Strain CCMP2471" /LENGTH=131 /DNA_ID=CAMNT_0007556841 /DNA_START=370 /DNA_END=765 /DNA_ORIENTATION=+
MLTAVRRKESEKRSAARSEANAAVVGVRDALARLETDVHEQAEQRAEHEEKRRNELASAVDNLEEMVVDRNREAEGWLTSYDAFCKETQELGDTESWLRDVEENLRAMSSEMTYVADEIESKKLEDAGQAV